MDIVLWAVFGISVFAVLVLLLAMPFYFFDYALLRKEPLDLGDIEQTRGTPYEKLTPEIAKGQAWLRAAEQETISIRSKDGLKLVGIYLPAPNPKGVILMMHGYHSSALQDFACVLSYYQSLGYSMLLVHQRTHGESEGKYITFGDQERYDAVCWLEELVRRFGEDFPIFLDGLSMGATTVMLAASMELPGNVRGVIADCGFTSPREEFTHVLRMQFRLPPFPLIPLVQILAKHRIGFVFDSVNTVESMKKCRYPMLFIHGKDDTFVPAYMTEANYAACITKKTLLLVDGAGHGGSYLADLDGCQAALKKFLSENHANTKGNMP